MALTTYNKKRNFKKTAEPPGKVSNQKGDLHFVVQMHHASHLHYDFRLEMDGVLKSWAVPKGPSLNPDDKRLAMMVEDHPYSYKDFEGNIPEGNYGAGNVIVWDNGTYTPVANAKSANGDLNAALRKGHLSFVLKGKKLKGEFSLVKIKNSKQGNAWLLIKKEDKYASTSDVTLKKKSVISNSTLESLAKKYKNAKSGTTTSSASAKPKVAKAKSKPVKKNSRLKPMLAKLHGEAFDDPDWIFEIKYDGYRALADCNGNGDVDLYSRNKLSFNEEFKEVAEHLALIAHDCLLDGEVVVEDKNGISKFQLLQNFRNTQEGDLFYYVFDILRLDGESTTPLSQLERKELLQMLLGRYKLKNVFYSDYVAEKGIAFFKAAGKKGLEGIIAKHGQSVYQIGRRSADWLKIKISRGQEVVIAGITEPQGSRKHFGSLLLGVYQDGELQYAGHCGTGFTQQSLKELYGKFKPLFTGQSPFKQRVVANAKVQWMKPKLVCQVKFTEWTAGGQMRHPVFEGLRKDKKAMDVKREIPDDMKAKSKAPAANESTATNENDYELKVGKTTLKLTNQNKLYWGKEKITKGELVNYYDQVADVMLPYLKDRPESLHRFPNGINDAGFYQKDLDTDKIPGWLHTEQVYSESNKGNIDYLVCSDKATLLYMANLGCIEINPWNSRIQSLDNPDWIVIDLDPENIPFKEVVRTALQTRKIFDELEIDCYCKTSGATGLHIYVPLAAKYPYDIARTFAELIARRVNDALPDITSVLRAPKLRNKKVYVDFLQNSRGQTLAAPYSVRPKPGATVSTPLEWSEVNSRLSPEKFTIKNTLKRLDKKGDLWKPVLGKAANLDKAIKQVYERE